MNKRLSKENQTLKQQYEQAQRQLAALTGVQPPQTTPTRRLPQGVTDEMVENARSEFALIFGEKAARLLSDEKLLDTFFEFTEKDLPQFRESHTSQWRSLGASHGRALTAEIKTQIGDVDPKFTARIFNAFRVELEQDEEFFARYEQGDPTLAAEFIADYKKALDGYHTRQTSTAAAQASAAVTRARTLPRGGSSSTVVPAGQAPQEPANEDERHRSAFRRMRARQQAATA